MSTKRDPAAAILHVLRLYSRGVLCPTETWFTVLNALPNENAEPILNGLPAESQLMIRELTHERSAPTDPNEAARFSALKAWCEQNPVA